MNVHPREWKFSQYDGQIYVNGPAGEELHAELRGPHDMEIQVGSHACRVEIEKLYGPTIMWPIRVTIDVAACEWVIEREFGPEGEWREVARVPGQLDSDFTDQDDERDGHA